LARVAALMAMSTPKLKEQWQALSDTPPPPYNRHFLESRLAYRIRELAYGGLKPETVRRLDQLGEQLDGGNIAIRKVRGSDQPIAGTRLLRACQGIEHTVTVLQAGYEWQGRPYKSLSAIARAIIGTRRNGLVFFGLKNMAGRAQRLGYNKSGKAIIHAETPFQRLHLFERYVRRPLEPTASSFGDHDESISGRVGDQRVGCDILLLGLAGARLLEAGSAGQSQARPRSRLQ